MPEQRYVIVTPARNEAAFIGKTIQAVIAQTRKPQAWIIVDDGSTDGTAEMARNAAKNYPWISVIERPDRGFRSVGQGSAQAFRYGMDRLGEANYDYVCNLDADVLVGPRYYERMLAAFASDPKLGIAVGWIYEEHNGVRVRLRCQEEMVAGAAKCWRRACYEAIGGIVEHAAWDGIDCYKAMMLGWRTSALGDRALNITHMRPLCTSYRGVLHGWAQRGRGMRFFGSDLLWVCASSVFHTRSRPFFFAGGAQLYGFAEASFKRAPKLPDPGLRMFVKQWQRSRLKDAVLSSVLRRDKNE
jgi:glycosyltransferase involved in cell wall biosynthesis